MVTPFSSSPSTRIGDDPAIHAAAITPDDNNDLPTPCRAIFCGSTGNITVDTYGGETAVPFPNVATGSILPQACTRVRKTGTTATGLVAMW